MRERKIHMDKMVKITVLSADVNKELEDRYAIPNLGPCPFHQKGQVLYTDGVHKPEGMCDYAWDAVKVMACPLSQGELIQPHGTWLKDDHIGVAACLDGIRPVIFLVEALQGPCQ